MRPGKPLIFGRRGGMRVLGLPGNPVSAFVCALLFLLPLVRALGGRADILPQTEPARLGVSLPAGDRRAELLRGTLAAPAGRHADRHAVRRAGFLDGVAARRRRLLHPARAVRPGGSGGRALPDHPARLVARVDVPAPRRDQSAMTSASRLQGPFLGSRRRLRGAPADLSARACRGAGRAGAGARARVRCRLRLRPAVGAAGRPLRRGGGDRRQPPADRPGDAASQRRLSRRAAPRTPACRRRASTSSPSPRRRTGSTSTPSMRRFAASPGPMRCWRSSPMACSAPSRTSTRCCSASTARTPRPTGRPSGGTSRPATARCPSLSPRSPTPKLAITVDWRLADLVGYIDTWSAVRAMEKATGRGAIDRFAADLAAVWGAPERARPIRFPLSLRVGRVG